ncbi:MAG: proprotein convertase P-domain-containing protein [Blastocatellia bacterium]|nr:proprotein convertase P-domain-containing protein [Blastocatellia bacterium]
MTIVSKSFRRGVFALIVTLLGIFGTQTAMAQELGQGESQESIAIDQNQDNLTVQPNEILTYQYLGTRFIPDNNPTGVTTSINVPNRLTINSLSVAVTIFHTYRGDIQIDLVSPNGITARLKDTNPNDSADNVIATFTPTVFNGLTIPAGNWNLIVRDLSPNDTGSIRDWTLTLNATGGANGDFTLSITGANPQSVRRGYNYINSIKVNRTGSFIDPISLTYTVDKAGAISNVNASPNPIPGTGSKSDVFFYIPVTAPTGTARVTFIGTDTRGRQRTVVLTLSILQ